MAKKLAINFKVAIMGADSFLSKLENLLGRRDRPLPIGRPRKKMKLSEFNENNKYENRWLSPFIPPIYSAIYPERI